MPGVGYGGRGLRDRIFDLNSDLMAERSAGFDIDSWPADFAGCIINAAAIQIDNIGIIHDIAEVLLHQESFDRGLAGVLGVERVNDGVAWLSCFTIGIGPALGRVTSSFTDLNTGQGIAAGGGCTAWFTLWAAAGNAGIIFARRETLRTASRN